MYFPTMSNLHLLLSSMNNSKPIQLLFPLKPTIDVSDVCEEGGGGGGGGGGGDMDEEKEIGRCHSPSSSSSSSSPPPLPFAKEAVVSSKIINGKDNVKDLAVVNDEDDDDGYHTPTSPRLMIQATSVCPPAPKKPPPARRRTRKRKADHELIDVGDVLLLFCADRRVSKKFRDEAVTDDP